MDQTIRDGLEKRAKSLGFDSAQAYIRFWAKAETDGRRVNLDEDNWGEPSDIAAKRINQLAEEAIKDHESGKLKSYTSSKKLLEDLNNEIS